MSQAFQFKAETQDQGKRLDKFLSEKLQEYSRATIQKMIKEKNILISGKETKSSYKIKTEDVVEIKPPAEKTDLSPDPSVKIKIIHDEKDFAVIDKPAGLVVYPGTKHEEKTLVNGLLALWPEIKSVGEDPMRPGIVHRLDKDTSGIMIIAKNNSSFEYFKNIFKNREVKKTYLALVHGILTPREGIIDFPIRRSETVPTKQVAIKEKNITDSARPALTRFTVLKYLKDSAGNEYTLTEAMPETGRMHQIRVHFAALGHNIVGDKIYKWNKTQKIVPLKSHFLHAAALDFISPAKKTLKFSSPLPKELNDFLKTLIEIHP
ncbi:MAG: RluA family pseudouridine synthase [bacterium]|nr:RluA family pseudouridine synthase [bacterium]